MIKFPFLLNILYSASSVTDIKKYHNTMVMVVKDSILNL